MKPAVKVFSILSMAAAVGQLLRKSDGDERISWRGEKLHEAGIEAVGRYPFPALSKSIMKKIGKKVEEICTPDQDLNIVETLSFLVVGLVDIMSKTNKRNHKFIEPVLKRSVWCIELFDPKKELDDSHEQALRRYYEWAR